MKRVMWLLASVAALSGASAHAQKAPPSTVAGVTVLGGHAAPLSAYGKLPDIEDAAISPDGKTIALITNDGARRKVVTQRLSDMKIVGVVDEGDNKVRALQWAGNNNVIITRTMTQATYAGGDRREHPTVFDLNVTTGHMRRILDDKAYAGAYGPTTRMINGKPVLFVHGYSNDEGGGQAVYRIDLATDSATLVEAGGPQTEGMEIGPNGEIVAETMSNVRNREWSLKIRDARGLWADNRRLTLADAEDPPALAGLGRDGKTLLVQERKGDHKALREIASDGTWSEPLDLPPDARPIVDPVSRKMVGYVYDKDDRPAYVFFDPIDRAYWKAVVASFEGDPVALVDWSDDRKKYLVMSDSPTDGPGYFVVDMNTKHSTWIGNTYPALKPADIAPKALIHYQAADGLEVPAYLTLPRGKAAKNLPLIVFPHGGPQARDEPGFDWWAQAMASRGYAVLQPQFRGSEGFGRKFVEAGFGQWGRKMQTDLSDGVRYLAAQGTIDPKRVCIVGASYGGYAALAGPTLDPGVYRCAVSYAGPADMAKMTEWSLNHNGLGAERYWVKFMGAETNRDQAFAAISPARFAARADAPILMIHGKDDTVVPLEQSQIMVNALKAAGKPVEFVVLPGQDHWLSRGDTRLKMLEATVAFVEKHNPPN